jgi:hypothetical protein
LSGIDEITESPAIDADTVGAIFLRKADIERDTIALAIPGS